ncbi:uncharacterized protein hdly [Anabrus simplex]|uniref:uncharacterized protein hdly n=1 Tax=Anabrus simplex TaxID=316456 RepID=UPI0035A36FF4
MTNMFCLILPSVFLVDSALSWGADGGALISDAHSEQYSKPNYWRNSGRSRVVYYSQPVEQQQQQQQQQQRHYQQWKPSYFNNRVHDLDDDRIVFVNDATDSFKSNVFPATAFAKSTASSSSSVHGIVPVFSSAKSKKEQKIEWTTVAPVSSTPAIHSGTKDESVNVIPTGPSKCVWAIISCCTPRSNVIRHECFELLGCQGAFWDVNPCDGRITQSAVKLALNFYSTR